MLRLLMKDGYGQSIRERKVLKSVRPQSSRKNNKKKPKKLFSNKYKRRK
jgi:hypothetical protein